MGSEREWKLIANGFSDLWQYPQCIGAMDGKQYNPTALNNSGSEFFNYKGIFSVVLFAIIDANY